MQWIKNGFFASGNRAINQTGIDRLKKIDKLVYRLAKDDDLSDTSLSQDASFLFEYFEWTFNDFPQRREVGNAMWVFFLNINSSNILIVLFHRNPNNDDFNFVFQPIQNNTNPSARSPLLYQCILNSLQWG